LIWLSSGVLKPKLSRNAGGPFGQCRMNTASLADPMT
jgi:hypothetical protein